MIFSDDITDNAALQELGSRIARHRLDRNISQAVLAEEAGISLRTLVRIEQGDSSQTVNILRALRALGLLANMEALIPHAQASPMQQLKLQSKRRKRASPATSSDDDTSWHWSEQ